MPLPSSAPSILIAAQTENDPSGDTPVEPSTRSVSVDMHKAENLEESVTHEQCVVCTKIRESSIFIHTWDVIYNIGEVEYWFNCPGSTNRQDDLLK